MSRRKTSRNLDLFAADDTEAKDIAAPEGWPPAERFPLNEAGSTVGAVVRQDLRDSQHPLVVTGYAGLGEFLQLAGSFRETPSSLRLLVGTEPHDRDTRHLPLGDSSIPAEARAYWLERGISLQQCGDLLRTVEGLRQGWIRARYLSRGYKRLHAKMYVGDGAVTLGSSNFTRSGLEGQFEVNARFTQRESRRLSEARSIAENYWSAGTPYEAELLALLESLLRLVRWDEALARACAELLEGEWAETYLASPYDPDVALWPAQRQGIAQALWLLDNVGSVLVADATGSGKTRMGAQLLRAAFERIWSSGRMRKGLPLVICPAAVQRDWQGELQIARLPARTVSDGQLSQPSQSTRDAVEEPLKQAQLLALDESHKYLNRQSRRTQAVMANMADHTILFTATPMNRSPADLIHMANLLGPDNFEESTVRTLERLAFRKEVRSALSEDEGRALRREIQRFTVRRTKRQLNALIDRDPDAYRDARGNRCRYPRHESRSYALDEPRVDREIAEAIQEEAANLRGLHYLGASLAMPEGLARQGFSESDYLMLALNRSALLAQYYVRATLRSSRAALIEHLRGTDRAIEQFGLANFSKSSSGDRIGHLARSEPPSIDLATQIPAWLADPKTYAEACERERTHYENIEELALQLSGHREQRKVQLLSELAARHALVLAFDSRPITLALLRDQLQAHSEGDIHLATGDRRSDRGKVARALRPGSEARQLIALCSDSLSEGLNLQQASAMVHLDMPTTVRVAEQRVGRVDRMDSPHERVEVWWPDDAPAFALRTDERFVARHEFVDRVLGSNLPLPAHFRQRTPSAEPVSALAMARQVEAETEESLWDGIRDAFEPARNLVEGPEALIHPAVYEQYRHITETVLARVSLVQSTKPWAFFCLRAVQGRAPRWILIPGTNRPPQAELRAVVDGLRSRLAEAGPPPEDPDIALPSLDHFLDTLKRAERSLLPARKRIALTEMEHVLGEYAEMAGRAQDQERADFLFTLLERLRRGHPDQVLDWDALAVRWLDLIRPAWYRLLGQSGRSRLLRLKDLRHTLIHVEPLDTATLRQAFDPLPLMGSLDHRIAACIVGVTVPGRRR